ncbi:MAG: hypothetical protein QXT45_08090 [Candidatus Bilamarchaeaceae archaeon]
MATYQNPATQSPPPWNPNLTWEEFITKPQISPQEKAWYQGTYNPNMMYTQVMVDNPWYQGPPIPKPPIIGAGERQPPEFGINPPPPEYGPGLPLPPPPMPIPLQPIPDIDYLRNMPPNIPQLYQMYADIAEQTGRYLRGFPSGVASAYSGYADIIGEQYRRMRESAPYQELQQQFRQDVQALRQPVGQSGIDQAYLTTAYENVDRNYDAARQRLLLEYARRGIEPSSGIVQSELRKLEEARAADKAKAERDLAMWKIQEQRSRAAEARQIQGMLEALERQRIGQELGIAGMVPQTARALEEFLTGRLVQSVPFFATPAQLAVALDQLERSRRAEARGIETMLNEFERQRILDALSLLTGTYPSAGPSSVIGNYAASLANLAGQLGMSAGSAWENLGSLIGWITANQRTQQPQPQIQVVPDYYWKPTK